MAIFKATYTKHQEGARASIKYIQHRPGKDGAKVTRELFGSDGRMNKREAYAMIDQAKQGSLFFRFVISPDPKTEDMHQDLHLREITERTMHTLEERLANEVSWVAVEHIDHAPHRHVHVVAVVPGRLAVQDFHALRSKATAACLEQRQERDLKPEQTRTHEEEVEWELGR
jgi:uncharacterized protein YcbX